MRDFMIALLACSVTMAVLALCYMALTPLLAKRYSERGRYYAWLIIVVGLIVPFRPDFGNAIVNVGVQDGTATPLIQIGNGTPVMLPLQNGALQTSGMHIPWWQVAMIIWLAGAVVYLAYHMIKHYRFTKLAARWSETVTDPEVLGAFQALKTEMGISKEIGLYLCSSIGGPMMTGLTHPRILLPKTDFAEDELRFILKHELVHFKRKDLWYKCLVLVASAVHWFNPIVYLMGKTISALCETSCDAEVVRNADSAVRQQYSETIIGVIRHQSKLQTVLSTYFYGGKKGMKKRIFSIFDTHKKKAGVAIICIALIATVGTSVAFAANPAVASPQESANPVTVSPQESGYVSSDTVDDPGSLQEAIKPYEHLGVSFDQAANLMMYEGHPVREICDNVLGTIISESIGPNGFAGRNVSGAIDLTVVYENNQPVRFHVSTQEEYDRRTEERKQVVAEARVKEAAFETTATATTGDPQPGYENFGISYDANNKMLFNGKLVRYFWDGFEVDSGYATHYEYLNEDGVVDAHTVRSIIDNGDGSANPFGELLDIVAYSQQEFDARDRDIDWLKGAGSAPQAMSSVDDPSTGDEMIGSSPQTTVIPGNSPTSGESIGSGPQAVTSVNDSLSNGEGKTFAEWFATYEDLGIKFVEIYGRGGAGNVFYQGQAVKRFIDEKNDGGVFSYASVDGGEITVRTVYDANGTLTGIKIVS